MYTLNVVTRSKRFYQANVGNIRLKQESSEFYKHFDIVWS